MKYIDCERPGKFVLKEKNEPKKVQGEAILKIKKVGICGTDLHAYSGNQAFFNYPRILGHELASEVIEIEENSKGIMPGENVVVMPYVSCHKCMACLSGKTNCCTKMQVLGIHTDGGMQEKISVPISLLIRTPKLSDDAMAIVEPLAIGAHAIRRANVQSNETIVVVGCGPIGIGIMKLAQIAGARVIAIDVNKGRLTYAKEKVGVDHVVFAGEGSLTKVKEITNNDLATTVFDATGNKGALEFGHNFMSHGGKYILVGLSKGEITFEHPVIHAKETTLMCSRNATLEDFEHVIAILEEGSFPLDSFITHNVGFNDMITEFDNWLDPGKGVIKATVNF